MPKKKILPETVIVNRWLSDSSVTSRSLGLEYSCSHVTISNMLHRNLSAEIIDATKRSKLSISTSNREDLRTEAHRKQCRNASAMTRPESRKRNAEAMIKASVASRIGRPLSESHKAKLAMSHLGLNAGSASINWRGGTSKVCWRGKGWTVARRNVRQRDNNTCQLCGKNAEQQKRNMDVHHRRSYFAFTTSEEANDSENLICLCRSCHRKVENGTTACP